MAPKRVPWKNPARQPLGEDLRKVLGDMGKDVPEDAMMVPWANKFCGAASEVFQGRCIRLSTAGKLTTVCVKCGWESSSLSVRRPLVHMLGTMTQRHWKERTRLQDVPKAAVDMIHKFHEGGARVAACSAPLDKKDILRLADEGLEEARMWCVYQGWRTTQEFRAADHELPPPCEDAADAMSPEETQKVLRLLVMAGVQAHMSFRSIASPYFAHLLGSLSGGRFRMPGVAAIRKQVSLLAEAGQAAARAEAAAGAPWTVTVDSATGSRGERFTNIMAVSTAKITLFLDLHDAGSQRQTSQYLQRALKECVLAFGIEKVAAITADSASSCRSALAALKLDPDMEGKWWPIHCCEHGAQLQLGDAIKGTPWLKSIARDLAGVHRYVKKHTRLQAWLTRTLQDLHREGHMRMPPCLLPLRRNTRFCSERSLLSAHLQCRDGLELAARMPEFRQMVGYDTLSLKKKERFNKVEGLLTKVSARARAERAAHILHPLAELVRVCGTHDTPVLPPAWVRLSGEFLARYHKLDFADRTPGGAAAKAERQEAMRDMVRRREEQRARAGAPRASPARGWGRGTKARRLFLSM